MDEQGDDTLSPKIWLSDRIPKGVKLGLENCTEMLIRLGNPEKNFPSVHVAGTNGKGSLCANLSALAAKNKLIVGFFSSPHLIFVEERARINGRPVDSKIFDKHLKSVMNASLIEPIIEPTYFETTFLTTMLVFADAEIDIGIIETGLGGRLDATRLVDASVCAITTISHDHSEILGDTLVEIASEKAAIYRPNIPLFSLYHKDMEVRNLFKKIAGNDLKWFKPVSNKGWEISKNFAKMIASYLGWKILDYQVIWPGRSPDSIKWIENKKCIVSAAHNIESIENDLQFIDEKHVMLLGMTKKSNLDDTLKTFKNYSNCCYSIITEPSSGRNPSVSSEEIISKLKIIGFDRMESMNNTIDAFKKIELKSKQLDSSVLIIGSIYLIGDIMNYIAKRDNLNLYDLLTIH